MSLLDESPRTGWTPRLHRRHEIVTTGGMQGVLQVGNVLSTCGFPVRDFSAEVREGVVYGSVTCTVSLTDAESEAFAARLRELPTVVSVGPC